MRKITLFNARARRKYIDSSRKKVKRWRRALPSISRSDFHPLKGHPLVLPVLTFLVLFFVTASVMVLANGTTVGASDSKIVTLSVNGVEQTVPTRAKTVKELLNKLAVEVNEGDIVQPAVTAAILEDTTIIVQKARPVTIIDGTSVKTVLSAHQQLRTVVKDAGISLFPEDGVEVAKSDVPQTSSGLSSQAIIGEQVLVDRALPATIYLYGNLISVRTRAATVGELLSQKDIKTISGDTIQPTVDTPLTANMQIYVVRMGKQIVTSEEAIPAPSVTVDDASLPVGSLTVKEPGSDGKKIVTYEVDLQNGIEVARRTLQEVVAVEPVRKVMAKGTKVLVTGTRAEWLVAAGISPNEYYAVDYIVGRESGWCPTKWQGQYGGCPAYHGTPTSSGVGYGLCQATPGYKMASAGADWGYNPVTQLKWCTGYARGRYGSWTAAYNFWVVNHWW